MDWRDQGALLSVRQHGESSVIIEVFTADHGRHAGVVRGGASRKQAPILQPGAQLDVTWRARLSEHLGSFTVEPIKSRAAQVMGDRLALSGLNAVTTLLCFSLPEREAHSDLYRRTIMLLDLLGEGEAWPMAYLRWEIALLDELGIGLDLSQCAATGALEGLEFISPRTGRAVSKKGAGEWADRLLPLPAALLGKWDGETRGIADALRVLGHFLEHKLAHQLGDKPVPAARQRFVDLLDRHSSRS